MSGSPVVNLGKINHDPVRVTRGYFYGDSFAARQSELALECSGSDQESLEKLISGPIRYLVIDEQVLKALFLLMRKTDHDARRLMLLFNAGLHKLERSGRLARLWKV